MQEVRRARPATAEDFSRLAGVARERGLEVIVDAEGRHFVTSASEPGHVHYVTGFSCTCRGFISHQRCTHLALLLDALGWLPEIEDETTKPCQHCHGRGQIFSEWYGERRACPDCAGTGVYPPRRPDGGAPALLPVAEPVAA